MPDLCTVADVKQLSPRVGSQDDAKLAELVTRASVAIEGWTQRQLAPVSGSVTRRFAVYSRRVDLAPCDLRTATTITLNPGDDDETVLAAADYALDPVEGAYGSTSSDPTHYVLLLAADVDIDSTQRRSFGRGVVQIAGSWGLAATPDDVVQACALTAASWADRAVDAYDLSPQLADARASLPPTARGFSIPEGARRLLDPFRRLGA